jgi:hypothetical protein
VLKKAAGVNDALQLSMEQRCAEGAFEGRVISVFVSKNDTTRETKQTVSIVLPSSIERELIKQVAHALHLLAIGDPTDDELAEAFEEKTTLKTLRTTRDVEEHLGQNKKAKGNAKEAGNLGDLLEMIDDVDREED